MTSLPRSLPLWRGRAVALVGILLVAFNVRTATSAIAPVADTIAADIGLTSLQLGVIGTLPPIAFAATALFGAQIARRVGLERLMTIAIVVMVVGHAGRAASTDFWVMLVATVVALAGGGIGNVLLPPLVKRYFPDRIALVTAVYVSIVSASAAVPSAVAAPLSDEVGWRFSLAVWCVVAAVCLAPWVWLLVRDRRARNNGDAETVIVRPRLAGMWRSRVAWAVAIAFSLSSAQVYAAFAWLPLLLVDTAGVSRLEAGAMLGLYALMGVPIALVIPALVTRIRNVALLLYAGIGFYVVGYAGMLLAPAAAPWVWIVLLACGGLTFPLALTLINVRTYSERGSVALSGFAQGVGYTLAAAGPFVFSLLHDITGGWTASLVFLLVICLAAGVAGLELRKGRMLEDELGAPRH